MVQQKGIYVLASIHEGGPLTLLESMALGLVPVCGDIPCLVQEVITEANGFRVPRANADANAGAIGKLHADRDLWEQMSRAASAAIVADFSADAMAHRYLTFLESLPLTTPVAPWPETIEVKSILGGWPLLHCGLARVVRRLIKSWRSRIGCTVSK